MIRTFFPLLFWQMTLTVPLDGVASKLGRKGVGKLIGDFSNIVWESSLVMQK